jgi:hypothetical protein
MIEGIVTLVEDKLRDEIGRSTCSDLEQLRTPLLRLRTDKYVELTKAREKCRHPKDKDLTDWDRKVMNDAMVAELQAEYDYLLGLEILVKERIGFFNGGNQT